MGRVPFGERENWGGVIGCLKWGSGERKFGERENIADWLNQGEFQCKWSPHDRRHVSLPFQPLQPRRGTASATKKKKREKGGKAMDGSTQGGRYYG